MNTVNITNARQNLYRLMDEVLQSHEPLQITCKGGSTVVIPEEDWRSIQETLYLTSIPGMVESIREGMNEPIEECVDEKEIEW